MGVSVTVGVSMMLRLLLLLLGGNIQWQLVCRRLGGVEFCKLCDVVTVALTAAGFWVWRKSNRVTVLHRNNLTWRTFFFVAIFTFTERLEVQPLCI